MIAEWRAPRHKAVNGTIAAHQLPVKPDPRNYASGVGRISEVAFEIPYEIIKHASDNRRRKQSSYQKGQCDVVKFWISKIIS